MKNKSLFGILLGAAAIILAVSPEGRKAVRKIAVKGTGAWLEIKDQIKEATFELPAVQKDTKRMIDDSITNEI
ncbi:hypothetical protein SAMN04487897_104236 [Paenibacillus sp. yr247]|uniref:hypothetical protein n=1 Tax=Paenibacillus sp. yr247 TaxID=1761880 RepID=UPI00088BAF90|nr:hypothetical protein [Paenibacillus sp. yr247]SDN73374.1 hypothetical protein SAMN04487897_104236 [Paenibacillus sp. yr247]